MAARTRKIKHDEFTKDKIRTSQLINRLSNHALGKVELSTTQVRAIEILLRKTLPDLASVQADVEGRVGHYEAQPIPVADREPIPRGNGVDAAARPSERRH